MTAQVFARVLESVRRHQPLAGTLFPVDDAGASVGGVAVRLPPWVGRGQGQQQAPDPASKRAISRAPGGSGGPAQSTSGSATSNGSASRVQQKSWAAPASQPRPGFPVQRSPATSPQKPSATSAATVKAPDQPSPAASSVETSEDCSADAAGGQAVSASRALSQQQEASQQQQRQQHAGVLQEPAAIEQRGGLAHDAAAQNGAEPSSAGHREGLGKESDRSDAAASVTAAAQAADKPSASAISAEQVAKVPVANSIAAGQPVHTADMDQQHDNSPSSVAMQPTDDLTSPDSNHQQAPLLRGEVAPADIWDGNDAALLAVIVEHAKVLRTINAGEAGSSCSLM